MQLEREKQSEATTNMAVKFPIKKPNVHMESRVGEIAAGAVFGPWLEKSGPRLMLVGVHHRDSPQCLGTVCNLDLCFWFLLIRTFSLDPLDHPHCDLPPRWLPVSSVVSNLQFSFTQFKGKFHICKLPLWLSNAECFCACVMWNIKLLLDWCPFQVLFQCPWVLPPTHYHLRDHFYVPFS